MIAAQQCFIGTVNADGTPNVAPKRSTRVLTDEALIIPKAPEEPPMQTLKTVRRFLWRWLTVKF